MSEQMSLIPAGSASDALAAARAFCALAAELDRTFRRAGETVPTQAANKALAESFWEAAAATEQAQGADDAVKEQCRQEMSRWLFRSRYWNRAFHKPHGYAGDFRMLEWMYDLENDPCADPTQPAIVNCLDALFATVHSVRSIWERRTWFARLLSAEFASRGRLRVLDVASGGARYLCDFLSSVDDTTHIEVTLVDQDASALAYCRHHSLGAWSDRVKTLNLPIASLPERLHSGDYDVILSTGLFDYLDDAAAAHLLGHLARLTCPGAVVAISNFHPEDPSRFVTDWLVDWPLIYRDEDACSRLFPQGMEVATSRSKTRALAYAFGRV